MSAVQHSLRSLGEAQDVCKGGYTSTLSSHDLMRRKSSKELDSISAAVNYEWSRSESNVEYLSWELHQHMRCLTTFKGLGALQYAGRRLQL